jgi:hypothetical protein
MTRENLQQHVRNSLHTIAILIKETERLLELRYLLLSQLLHHVFLSPAVKIDPPERVRLQAKGAVDGLPSLQSSQATSAATNRRKRKVTVVAVFERLMEKERSKEETKKGRN